MHVMVKDRTAELKSEATVALDFLATRCKKENGKLEIWVRHRCVFVILSLFDTGGFITAASDVKLRVKQRSLLRLPLPTQTHLHVPFLFHVSLFMTQHPSLWEFSQEILLFSVCFWLSWSWSHRAACWWRPRIIWRKVVSGSKWVLTNEPSTVFSALQTKSGDLRMKMKLSFYPQSFKFSVFNYFNIFDKWASSN